MRVLSIDGGGIRGIVPALVLCEIERRTGRRVAEMFDLIAGTSTGGILACALARPGALAADELLGLYSEEGPDIFRRTWLKRLFSAEGLADERYEDDGLNDALQRFLGDAYLRECTTEVMVTAYDIKGRFAFFFRSERARRDPTYDFPLWEVARATSAAPTYFEPWEATDVAGARAYPLIDGGIFANNPAMCALADCAGKDVDLLLSLGTGSQIRPYDLHKARWWGQLEWARPLVDMVFDGLADTVDFQVASILGDRYVRLQTPLDVAQDDMDDASEQNLADLREDARRLVRREERAIERVCAILSA